MREQLQSNNICVNETERTRANDNKKLANQSRTDFVCFFNSIQLERLCVYRSCVKVCQLRLLLIHAQQFKHCLAVNGFGRQSSGVLFGVSIHYEVCMDFSFTHCSV